ncbi:MAG TPA: NAD-dependent epimerase/dehydratase family protein [Phototrophicaceae bacterium]|nr:NAD-dependent epimerase/dehydratase family protein [Phototrophicaceae bacterium]
MTVLVTGASGHVGTTLIPKLLEAGCRVRAVDIQYNPILQTLPIEFVQADTRDLAALEAAFAGVEVVYHLASYISIVMDEWPILEAVNINGTRNVVTLCQKYQVRRLVHFSSIEALSVEPRDQPITENNMLVPEDFPIPYPRSKAAGQRLVLQAIQAGLDAVIIYPTGIIGPNDYGFRAGNQALVRIVNGEMRFVPNVSYDWVDVRDVAEGAIKAEQQAVRGASYILGNHMFSMPEMAAQLTSMAGIKPSYPIPAWTAQLARPFMEIKAALTREPSLVTQASLYPVLHSHTISHERATAELGYQPRPLTETLCAALAWYQQIGKLKTAALAAVVPDRF